MTKIVLIISMLALLAAGGLAVVNRSAFVKARNDKDSINKEIKEIKDRYDATLEKEFGTLGASIKSTAKELADAEARFGFADEDIKAKKAELETEMAKEAPLDEKIANFDKLITDLQAKFPGLDANTLPETISSMEKENKDLLAAQEALRAESEVLTKKVEGNRSVVARYQEKQAERAQGVARNATTPVITAVNQEWGFVVFNAGKNLGVTPESRLIATRGGQVICRLNVVSAESGQTVANIDRSSLREGAMVLPGDLVIFQNLQE